MNDSEKRPLTENGANVLILGIGNILLSDEGAGIRVVEGFQGRYLLPPEVEAVDGGTLGLALLPYLKGRSHVLLIDAVKGGKAPGTISRMELTDPPAFLSTRISPHQIGLSEILTVATLTDGLPPIMILFGIEPSRLEVGLEMSPEVAANIDPLIERVAHELAGMKISLRPRPAGVPTNPSFPAEEKKSG
ncbi:MAG: HyaD/HybD family hydrogenase maturation endopeptidase [Deltaproteobacteria bacterium]|jgi:hydrogenase maturation protease